MALKTDYEFAFVGSDDNSFLENYSYDRFEDHGARSGQIFVTLEVQNNLVDADEIGTSIFEVMQKVFFEDVLEDPYVRFELALKEVNKVLNDFKSQKVSGYIGNLNIIVAGIVDDKLFLSQTGDAEAYLIRKRYVSVVSDGLDDGTDDDVFVNIASGQIESGDFVCFSSTRLLRYMSKTDFAQFVGRKSVLEVLSDIKDAISTEVLGRVALAGLIFSEVDRREEDLLGEEEHIARVGGYFEEDDEHESRSVAKEHFSGDKLKGFAGGVMKKLKKMKFPKSFSVKHSSSYSASAGDSVSSFLKGRNNLLISLVILIFVLIIGIVFLNGRRVSSKDIKEYDTKITSVLRMLDDAETKVLNDKNGAREILDKAYNDAVAVMNSGYFREKASLSLSRIDELRDTLDNVQRIEKPNLVVDLSSKRSDVNALGFAVVSGRKFIYEYNALYELVLDQVQDPLTIDDKESIISATGFDERNSVVFLTKSGKLIEYKDGNFSFMDTSDGAFHKAVDIADWSNRIYLLDPSSSQVWRYPFKATSNKFGVGEAYLGDGVDLSGAKSLAIDASLYVLNSNGDISKFYGGQKVDFTLEDAPTGVLKSPKSIYADEDLSDIYVLDADEARVLVFTKDENNSSVAHYKAQYLFDGVGEARDIYVDVESKTLYLLTASKVYSLDLN